MWEWNFCPLMRTFMRARMRITIKGSYDHKTHNLILESDIYKKNVLRFDLEVVRLSLI